jgi:hypothetical protein
MAVRERGILYPKQNAITFLGWHVTRDL